MENIKELIKPILVLLIIILGFSYFFATTFTETKPNDQILIAIVGLMTGACGYYFGYSSGSAKKDEIINEQLTNKT